jgi:hypothetical protein
MLTEKQKSWLLFKFEETIKNISNLKKDQDSIISQIDLHILEKTKNIIENILIENKLS